MNVFNSFSEAFKQAVDSSGFKQSYFYKKIGMDSSQFSKYYHGEIRNPQIDTQNTLNELVGNRIKRRGAQYELLPLEEGDARAQSGSDIDLNHALKKTFKRIDELNGLYKDSQRRLNLSPQQKEIHAEMVHAKLKEILESI